jgi:acetylornithine deacetylase/succinyl-diaminopimelate desuccinylase-like protein
MASTKRKMELNNGEVKKYVDDVWGKSVVPTLCDYISIPNQSPGFDTEWATNGPPPALMLTSPCLCTMPIYPTSLYTDLLLAAGLIDKAVDLLVDWVKKQKVDKLQMRVERLPNRTPLIFIEIPATAPEPSKVGTVLLYGHLDKQPPFEGWDEVTVSCISCRLT